MVKVAWLTIRAGPPANGGADQEEFDRVVSSLRGLVLRTQSINRIALNGHVKKRIHLWELRHVEQADRLFPGDMSAVLFNDRGRRDPVLKLDQRTFPRLPGQFRHPKSQRVDHQLRR